MVIVRCPTIIYYLINSQIIYFGNIKLKEKKLNSTTLLLLYLKFRNWIVSLAHIIINKNKDHPSEHIRKIGCTARVTVYSITLYPDFCVSKEKTSDLSCRGLKQKKKEKLCELRDVTSKGKPLSSIMKYYVILPGEEAHHEYHETHGAASYAQHIHPKLRSTSLWVKAQQRTSLEALCAA